MAIQMTSAAEEVADSHDQSTTFQPNNLFGPIKASGHTSRPRVQLADGFGRHLGKIAGPPMASRSGADGALAKEGHALGGHSVRGARRKERCGASVDELLDVVPPLLRHHAQRRAHLLAHILGTHTIATMRRG